MTFRDDHDTTLARADALERELEETRRKLAVAQAALVERSQPRAPRTATSDRPLPIGLPARPRDRAWVRKAVVAGLV